MICSHIISFPISHFSFPFSYLDSYTLLFQQIIFFHFLLLHNHFSLAILPFLAWWYLCFYMVTMRHLSLVWQYFFFYWVDNWSSLTWFSIHLLLLDWQFLFCTWFTICLLILIMLFALPLQLIEVVKLFCFVRNSRVALHDVSSEHGEQQSETGEHHGGGAVTQVCCTCTGRGIPIIVTVQTKHGKMVLWTKETTGVI